MEHLTNAMVEFRPPHESLINALLSAFKRDITEVREPLITDTLLWPTDIVLRAGRPIGYISIGVVPSVQMWFDKAHVTTKDYLATIGYYEGLLARQGIKNYFLPCEDNELNKFVLRLGFKKTDYTNVYIKNLVATL